MSFKELVNASTMFLLRGLGLDVNLLAKYGFISAYVDDIDHDIKYERGVYLLFKPKIIDELQKFLMSEYKKWDGKDSGIKEDYDYLGGYVVAAYVFPSKYQDDYQKFLMGEYSKFSEAYKKLFPKEITLNYPNGKMERTYDLTYHIFEKSEGLRDNLSIKVYGSKINDEGKEIPLGLLDEETELWSSPDLTGRDVLDIDRISKDMANIINNKTNT